MKRIYKANQNGFSLVELLVVLGIMSIVLAAAFSLLLFGNSTFNKGTKQSGVQDEARRAMDFVNSEVRNAKSIMLTAPVNPAGYQYIHVAPDKQMMFRQAGGVDISKTGPVVISSNDLSFRIKKAGSAYVLVSSITATDGARNYTITTDTKLNNIKSFSALDTDYHEIYFLNGSDSNTANSVASMVLSVSQPLQNDNALTIPAVPSGFTIAIKSVDLSTGPLNTSGVIIPPLADTVVNVTFTVTNTADGTTADTLPIAVLIPAKLTYTAASVANSISVMDPTLTSTSINMPVLPTGFTYVLKSGVPTGIIAANGTITFPTVVTSVSLIFTVTRTLDGSYADSPAIVISVPAKAIKYPAPTTLFASAANSGYVDNKGVVTLTWNDNTTNETKFVLERATNNTFTSPTAVDVGANLVTFIQSSLPRNTAFWYRIKAVDTDGESLWSNVAGVTTLNATVPPPPSNFVAVASSGGNGANKGVITLTWVDNTTGETGFTLQRATDSAFTIGLSSSSIPANATTVGQDKLANSILYYYRIQAVGGTIWTSAWSATVSVTTP